MLRKTSSTYKFSDEDIESLKKYSKMSLEDPANSHCIDMPDNSDTSSDYNHISDYGFFCVIDKEDYNDVPLYKQRRNISNYNYLCSPYVDGPETHIWTPNTKDVYAEDFQLRLSNYILTFTNSLIALATLFALWKSK
jgi:hypothetical protein